MNAVVQGGRPWGARRRPRPQLLAAAVVVAVVPAALPGAAAAAGVASINDIVMSADQVPRVLVVDDDGSQCPQADTASVQEALDRVQAGGLVRVCAGRYDEQLTVSRPVHLLGQVGPVASVDCLDPAPSALDDLDPTRFAILEPDPDTGAEPTTHVRITADDVELAGFVVQGLSDTTPVLPSPGVPLYDAAVSVGDTWSGTRLHHNLVRLNTLGVELGGSGERQSRVDHNCFRDNDWAIANQRFTLTDGRVDDNVAFGTKLRTFEIGWPYAGTTDVSVDHNDVVEQHVSAAVWVENSVDPQVGSNRIRTSGTGIVLRTSSGAEGAANDVEAGAGIAVTGTTGSRVVGNRISAASNGVGIGGGNVGLDVADNVLSGLGSGGSIGISVVPPGLRSPSRALAILRNTVTGWHGAPGSGLVMAPSSVAPGSLVADNVFSHNSGDGIGVGAGNNGLGISGNTANNNGANGIRVAAGALQNLLTENVALANAVDARDGGLLADGVTPTSNQWVRTTCVTDVPVGQICVPPAGPFSP